MANHFRPHHTKTDSKTGATLSVQAKTWYGQFVDADGRRQRVKLSRNKTAAQQMLNELVRKEELKRAGIVNPFEQQQARPLADHVRDWEASLHASGVTEKHVRYFVNCVKRILKACRFVVPGDLSASRLQQYLAELRQQDRPLPPLDPDKGIFTKAELAAMLGMQMGALSALISRHRLNGIGNGKARRFPRATAQALRAMRGKGQTIRTSNANLAAMKQFCRWMVQDRRMLESPLAHLSGGNVKTDRRHDRRKLTADELRKLIATTQASRDAFRGLFGKDRAVLYSLACGTGFRVSELASLLPGAFALTDDPPTVTLAGENAKNGQAAVQPLPPDVVQVLHQYLASKAADPPVWRASWPAKAAVMIRKDLEAAGILTSSKGRPARCSRTSTRCGIRADLRALDNPAPRSNNALGYLMRRLRRTAGVLIVWATAATTLLASTPHYDCRCPDGTIKRFCFSSTTSESSCCCSGTGCGSKSNDAKSCCRKGASSSKSTTKLSCCCKPSKPQHTSVVAGNQPVNGLTVRGTCCQKTLAQSEIQSSVRATTIVDETPSLVFVLHSAEGIEYLSNAAPSRTIWQVHWLPPPTDLVTILHRLVI
jgi:integrase